jgi:protein-disulfide isomerase
LSKKSSGRQTRQARRRGAAQQKQSGGNTKFAIIIGSVVVLGIAGLLFAMRSSSAPPPAPPMSVAETNVAADPTKGVAIGPEDAPVTIIEFSDFQCPHCRTFNAQFGVFLRQNLAEDEGILRWISYDFPLGFEHSMPTAIAGRCAEEQGKFWDMHDLLFARQDRWRIDANPNGKMINYAADLGLDTDQFEECISEPRYVSDIMATRKFGEQLGVTGTPSLFINGQPMPDQAFRSYQAMEQLIRQLAAQTPASD